MAIETVFALLLQYRYIMIVPLLWVVQPILAVALGIMGRLDLIDIPLAYVVLVGSATLGDICAYWFGARYGEGFVARYGKYVKITPLHMHVAKRLFNRYHAPVIVISKLLSMFGLGLFVTLAAGMSRIRFWRFVFFNALGEITWSGVMMLIGYFFGSLYLEIRDDFGRWSLILLGLTTLTAVVIATNLIRKQVDAYIAQEGRAEI